MGVCFWKYRTTLNHETNGIEVMPPAFPELEEND
jgi:hypothetical protein